MRVPADYHLLPLLRAYLEEAEDGTLLRVEVRQCPHSRSRVLVRTKLLPRGEHHV